MHRNLYCSTCGSHIDASRAEQIERHAAERCLQRSAPAEARALRDRTI